jgi:hypothetical protein
MTHRRMTFHELFAGWCDDPNCEQCAASGIETRSATDAERRGPKGESPTVEDGTPNPYPMNTPTHEGDVE